MRAQRVVRGVAVAMSNEGECRVFVDSIGAVLRATAGEGMVGMASMRYLTSVGPLSVAPLSLFLSSSTSLPVLPCTETNTR